MNLGILVITILLAIEICSTNYNINLTTSYYTAVYEAIALKGSSTKAFPKEAFLNFILYGRTDVPFKYYDFMSTYGTKTSSRTPGNLVIGNDGKLGGIVVDNKGVVLPIPKGKIMEISFSDLMKYFSKGYTILSPKNDGDWLSQKYFRSSTVTLNGQLICTTCTATISSTNVAPDLFTDNNQILYLISSSKPVYTLALFGHLIQYDNDTRAQTGNISITFGFFNTSFMEFTNPSVSNQVTFEFKLLRSTSSGLVLVNHLGNKYNYTFSSTEY